MEKCVQIGNNFRMIAPGLIIEMHDQLNKQRTVSLGHHLPNLLVKGFQFCFVFLKSP